MDTRKSLVHSQVSRVTRRLLLQKLGTRLIICWSGALVAAILWFLAQPFLIESPAPWLRWAVAGGLAGFATLLAGLLAWLSAPSPLTAALSLDEKFGLKERVTTSLALSVQEQASPAGQALLEDVHQRLEKIDVGSRFPLRLRWSASLVPALVMVLAAVAIFYDVRHLIGKSNPGNGKPELAATIKPGTGTQPPAIQPARPKSPAEQNEKAADLKKIDAELERIAALPHETPEQVTEKVKQISSLEDRIKELEKAQADRAKSVDQLSKLDTLNRKNKPGPADDMQDAMAGKGLDKARQEAEKLARKLKKKDLTDPEKEQLQKQVKELEDQVKRLSRQQDKVDRLKSKNLDPETLKQELEQLAKENKDRKDLDDLARQLNRCKECLEKGDEQKAGEAMEQMARQLQRMSQNEQEQQELQARMDELEDMKEETTLQREAGSEGSDKEGQEGKGRPGSQPGESGKKDGLKRKGGSGRGRASGRRPINSDGKSGSQDAREKIPLDLKGKKNFAGYAPGQKAPPRSGPQLEGVIRQQSQQAAEATNQQKLDKSDRDISKNYFGNLAEEVQKAKKAGKK